MSINITIWMLGYVINICIIFWKTLSREQEYNIVLVFEAFNDAIIERSKTYF